MNPVALATPAQHYCCRHPWVGSTPSPYTVMLPHLNHKGPTRSKLVQVLQYLSKTCSRRPRSSRSTWITRSSASNLRRRYVRRKCTMLSSPLMVTKATQRPRAWGVSLLRQLQAQVLLTTLSGFTILRVLHHKLYFCFFVHVHAYIVYFLFLIIALNTPVIYKFTLFWSVSIKCIPFTTNFMWYFIYYLLPQTIVNLIYHTDFDKIRGLLRFLKCTIKLFLSSHKMFVPAYFLNCCDVIQPHPPAPLYILMRFIPVCTIPLSDRIRLCERLCFITEADVAL